MQFSIAILNNQRHPVLCSKMGCFEMMASVSTSVPFGSLRLGLFEVASGCDYIFWIDQDSVPVVGYTLW